MSTRPSHSRSLPRERILCGLWAAPPGYQPDLRVLNLGAGVQSTTVLLMALHGAFDVRPDCAIFADTKWEPRAVYEHLGRLRGLCEDHGFPLFVVSAGHIRDKVLAGKNGERFASMPLHMRNHDGEPAMLRRQCTREFKVEPIERKIRSRRSRVASAAPTTMITSGDGSRTRSRRAGPRPLPSTKRSGRDCAASGRRQLTCTKVCCRFPKMKRFLPNTLLDTNPDGLALIRRCEQFVGRWYRCPAGVWTIGFGTTENLLSGVNRQSLPGPITKADAERLLRRALIQIYEPGVERLITVSLTGNQFSALVSFVYNVGVPRFAQSTLLRKLNRADYGGAAAEFDRWVFSNGQKLRGLVHRRRAERRLFETPDATSAALRSEIERVNMDRQEMKAKIEALEARIAELEESERHLKARIEELERERDRLLRIARGRNGEQPDTV